MSTVALIEPVDASIVEARSIYLEGEPCRASVAIYKQPVLWILLEEFHCRDLLFPMESSTGINRSCGGYLPLESMLLGAPDRSTTTTSSPWRSNRSFIGDRSVVEIDRIPRRRMEDNILQCDRSCGAVGPVGLCCCCSCGS